MKNNYLFRTCIYSSLVFLLLLPMANSYAQLGKCKGKYLGNIVQGSQRSNYNTYWNQATSENGSKWGSVEGSQGNYNWTTSDVAYNWAKNNSGLFKYHNFVWGAQTPGWISGASTATLTTSIQNYIKACSTHYTPMGGLKMIDVVNEPVNTALAANYKAALTAGYQAEPANANDKNNPYGWVIWPFQLARKYFPNAVLLINEYNVEMNWNNCRAPYIAMVNAVKNAPNLTDGQKNLINGVGLQCHGIENLTAANFKACIDEIWTKTGVPIHITEFDTPANPNEAKQQSVYSTLFPVAWEHAHVEGITLWGYVQGTTWINGNGVAGASGTDSGIIYANGTERPAMTWLKQYMAARPNVAGCGTTNVAPTVSLTSPANNSSFTSPATIAIAATAADADGTVSSVAFYNGTTLLGTDATSPYGFSWSGVAAGTYSITARATDNSGAVTTSSAVSVTVTAPVNVAPTVSLTSPANNSSFTSPATIAIAATAADADGTVSSVAFYNGTTLLGTDATSPYGFSWSGVGAGTYSITARATDNSGAVTTSSAVSVTVTAPVNVAPTVSLTSPANNSSFTSPATIAIAATAADADGTVSSVAFYNGTTLLGTDATSPYGFSWSGVGAGTYSITARATDNSGAVTTSTAVSVTVTGVANVAPIVNLTAPANNASYTAPATIAITAVASDSDGTVSSVAFYNGTTLLGTDATSPYSFNWTGVGAGTYSITAKATDNSGAVTTSSAVSVTVTAPVNVAPTVSITSPLNNASFTSPATIAIAATAADADGTVSSVAFYNGTTLLGTDVTSPYSFSWTGVGAGTYSITARATDNSGAVTTSGAVSVVVTNPTSTADIIGVDCGSNNVTLSFQLNTSKRANVTSYNWWYTGSVSSTTPVAGAPYSVNIQTGAYFSGGQVCVGTNLSVAPWYVQYCKSITKCAAKLGEIEEYNISSSATVVAPNPSSEGFDISFVSPVKLMTVTTILGTQVYSAKDIEASNLRFGQELPGGLYMVHVEYSNGQKESIKVQKVK